LIAADRLARAAHAQLPVVDGSGYLGVVTARAVADTLADGQHDTAIVASIVERPTAVRADQHLDAALDVLETVVAFAIPVLDSTGDDVIGWLTHQNVLTAMRGDRR
jgi:CIC family chloride channel protein